MNNLENGLKVDNVTDKAVPYLKDSTIDQLKLNEKPTSTVKTDIDGNVKAICMYYGSRSKLSKIDDAVQKVCGHLNRLGDEDAIKGSFGGVIKYDMALAGGLEEPECLVLAYVFLTPEIHAREQAAQRNQPVGSTRES